VRQGLYGDPGYDDCDVPDGEWDLVIRDTIVRGPSCQAGRVHCELHACVVDLARSWLYHAGQANRDVQCLPDLHQYPRPNGFGDYVHVHGSGRCGDVAGRRAAHVYVVAVRDADHPRAGVFDLHPGNGVQRAGHERRHVHGELGLQARLPRQWSVAGDRFWFWHVHVRRCRLVGARVFAVLRV